ncbi:gliding motility-associated lipoprotein GldB [Formosa sp. Hel1_31_208]|uniref:gliding motility lipoprotein GldB n=1 Tax=Formosa sp. Hel1_31_208 TaxID=1798225 RepID=UPI00087A0411|nr:gliding motility lipoprotein GldB [Formosa sp. Hel1_31_208]SDR66159.1 gliding motility-associated lipoprotein GldB [Formosa sp. Hel1_31_208]
MKQFTILSLLLVTFLSCKSDDALEAKISKIETSFIVERFDRAFASAKPNELSSLKSGFPFLFSKNIPDSIWIERMRDSFQLALHDATNTKFGDFKTVTTDIQRLFQHLKYYDKSFREPRVITLTNFVKYRTKIAVTDTIVLVAIDNYLGSDHEFYNNIPQYLAENMRPSQIVVDLAKAYSEKQIFQTEKKTLLDEMIFFGKQLYFKDKMIPFKTDAEKIGYTEQQLEFAIANEDMIWTHFVENEMLFDSDSSLPARFIADAPFSKFYLEIDNETPGRLGQFLGWQIVRAYMRNNKVSLKEMLQTEAAEIFNKSNYKPPK